MIREHIKLHRGGNYESLADSNHFVSSVYRFVVCYLDIHFRGQREINVVKSFFNSGIDFFFLRNGVGSVVVHQYIQT